MGTGAGIDRAVRRLVEVGKTNLRARLKEEAIANAERDIAIAAEWLPLEEKAAQCGTKPRRKKIELVAN